jgi:hypothetical protein
VKIGDRDIAAALVAAGADISPAVKEGGAVLSRLKSMGLVEDEGAVRDRSSRTKSERVRTAPSDSIVVDLDMSRSKGAVQRQADLFAASIVR